MRGGSATNAYRGGDGRTVSKFDGFNINYQALNFALNFSLAFHSLGQINYTTAEVVLSTMEEGGATLLSSRKLVTDIIQYQNCSKLTLERERKKKNVKTNKLLDK